MSNNPKLANLQLVRDHIATMNVEQFRMAEWGSARELRHGCGTAGCIGGWAQALLFTDEDERTAPHGIYSERVGAEMGLTSEQSDALFFPLSDDATLPDHAKTSSTYALMTQEKAVQVLDHLIVTGEVSWGKVLGLSNEQ